MNIFNRIILAIYMLVMIFVSLCIIVLPFNLIPYDTVADMLHKMYSSLYFSLIGLVLFVVSIKLLFSGIKADKKAVRGVVKPVEFGDINISVETFESLSLRVLRQISGIKDVKVSVSVGEGDITVNAKLLILPDINIPKVITEAQNRIKEYVENITEVRVKEVKVTVDNIAQVTPVRVE